MYAMPCISLIEPPPHYIQYSFVNAVDIIFEELAIPSLHSLKKGFADPVATRHLQTELKPLKRQLHSVQSYPWKHVV